MAKSPTESVPDMADGAVLDGTEVRSRIEEDQTVKQHIEEGTAEAVDIDDLKLKEKLFVQTRLQISDEADPTKRLEEKVHGYQQLNETNFPNMTTAELNQLRGLLKKVHDQHRTNLGYDHSST